MAIISVIKRIMGRQNPEKEAMDYCIKHGFRHGKNFAYHTGYPIDANFPWMISVGDDVTLATGVKLLAHDAATSRVKNIHTKVGIVRIGNNVFIGANTIVLPNVRIGNNVIVGAGFVVTRDILDNSVYAGNPAVMVCSFEEYGKKHIRNQETHPIFREHSWREWPDCVPEEWEKMREACKNTFGYL